MWLSPASKFNLVRGFLNNSFKKNKIMYSSNSINFKQVFIWILRLSVFCVFFGRGWEHLYTDAPFRTILWDASIMEGLITSLTNFTWNEYTSSSTCNFIIDASVKSIGLFYLICAVACLFIQRQHKKLGKILLAGSFFLIILSLLFYKTKFYKFGQFIEYSCQMFSPVFLYMMLFHKIHFNKFNVLLKTAITLTFIGHGLYALGIYITPGVWTDMAIGSFNFIGLDPSVEQVQNIIYLAGVLDMILAIGIFLPSRWATPFLAWALIWGLLTALSRVIGFMYFDPSWHTFMQWLPQTIMRLPHAIIPLAALAIIFKDSFLQRKPAFKMAFNS